MTTFIRITPLFFLLLLLVACGDNMQTLKPVPTQTAVPPTQVPVPKNTAVPPIAPTEAAVNPTLTEMLATNTPTEETAVEPIGQVKIIASGGAAHVRSGPSINDTVLTTVDTLTILDVLTQTEQSDWFKVVLEDGSTGWVGSTVAQPIELFGQR